MIKLDTENTIYIGLDGRSAEVKVLVPRQCKLAVVDLDLSNQDPERTDAAEYALLAQEMEESTFEI